MRLIQFRDDGARFVARIEAGEARVIAEVATTADLATKAFEAALSLEDMATRLGMASRYGRSEVIALYASATAMTRASNGISSPAS